MKEGQKRNKAKSLRRLLQTTLVCTLMLALFMPTGLLHAIESKQAASVDIGAPSIDNAGNITSANTTTTLSYDTQSHLMSINGQNTTYDADGNMTSYTLDNTTHNLAYDSANRLVEKDDTSYTYDILDNRTSRTDTNGTTHYVYDASEGSSKLLASTDASGTTYHIYGIGLIGSITPNNQYLTYHFDNTGSTTHITDHAGAVTDTFTYSPYGKLINHTGTINTLFHFNGQYGVIDDGDGLLFMKARYYSPDLMRFINADVLTGSIDNAITLNRYAFANGNPVAYVDPFGRSAALGGKVLGGLLDALQFMLDMGGIFFDPFDLANAGIYYARGDQANGDLSMATSMPVLGWEALALKYSIKGAKYFAKGDKVLKGSQDVAEAGRKGVHVTNDILEVPRTGSALKLDDHHAFNDIVDNYAGEASKFSIDNGTLYQIEGSLNGVHGRFEWIIQDGAVTHRMFVKGGTVTGVPTKP